MGQYGTAGDTRFSVLSGRAASRPTSRPEFSSRPYVERRDPSSTGTISSGDP